MKKIILLLALAFCYGHSFAQANYSGSYGYTLPNNDLPKNNTITPGGNLVLVKMEGNKYRFWLDVVIGPPGYNRGETDGTITFVNDTASFDNTFEDATHPCILKFKITKNVITINSESTSFNCGFGNGVNADGNYTRLKVQPVIDNKWLNDQYPESPILTITAKKALLYHDENCRMEKEGSFVKGKSLLNVAETTSTFYTEYITPQGKFMYGWIKKIDTDATGK